MSVEACGCAVDLRAIFIKSIFQSWIAEVLDALGEEGIDGNLLKNLCESAKSAVKLLFLGSPFTKN